MTPSSKPVSFYLLLIIGFILLIIALLLSILWYHNHNISHPLPITDTNEIAVSQHAESTQSEQFISIVAGSSLQSPLEGIITKFNEYYPHITTEVTYVTAAQIPHYVQQQKPVHIVISDANTIDTLYQHSLQTTPSNTTQDTQLHEEPFDFALLKKRATDASTDDAIKIQGYVLETDSSHPSHVNEDKTNSDSATALFKRFLLASSIQKQLQSSELDSIETNKNNVDELFRLSKSKPNDTNGSDTDALELNEMLQ